MRALSTLSAVLTIASAKDTLPKTKTCYSAAASVHPEPILSFLDGTSDYAQVFNPSWVEANADGSVQPGLLVRTQNCSGCGVGRGNGSASHSCCGCNMRSVNDSLQKRSILTFTPLLGSDGSAVQKPRFPNITANTVVFQPVDQPPLNDDFRGTEDPRIAYDKTSDMYYMFYTCYHKDGKGGSLCLASTKDPTKQTGWTRHGPPFPGDHKSGALLIRDSPPHYLISGAGTIHIAKSDSLTQWELGPVFINETAWGNPNVEAGPPPIRMSDGNYVFFHNSWGGKGVPPPGYQPSWVILDGEDPTNIIARAQGPLWSPNDYPWMAGYRPDQMCNVPQVAFLEAAHAVSDKPDTFRVYYGGSDAVLGTALVTFTKSQCQ